MLETALNVESNNIMLVVICTVPKSRAAVDYTLTGVEPHGPTRSV